MATTIANWTHIPHHILVKIFSNLSKISRANASATCKTWRNAYLSSCLWDDVQLCYDRDLGWEVCKKFVKSYGWIFRQVAIFPLIFRLDMFDANGYLLMRAAETYKKAMEELPELLDLLGTSTNLRRLQIKLPDDVMGSWGDSFAIDFFPEEVLARVWQSIISICMSSKCMESLELGYQINVIGDHLTDLSKACSQTLKRLHCINVDLVTDEPRDLPSRIKYLSTFKMLREINLNITYVTDEFLDVLAKPDHCQVQKIGILSTCIELAITDDTWTSDSKWRKLKEHSPDLKVTMSMYWPGIDPFKLILKPVIPLQSLSVMCDDQKLDPKFVDYITTHFKDTLVTIGLHCFTALSLFWDNQLRLCSKPLVRLAERCHQLKKVVVTGFEVFHEDIISIAEKRKDLDILDIAHDSIIYMDPERGDRSSDLGLDWIRPRENQDESTDERENREERDNRKNQLIRRVSDSFCTSWKPMNRETSAFSYWGFMDPNILPYKEISDCDKLKCTQRTCYCGRHFMEDDKNKTGHDSTRTDLGGDENVDVESASPKCEPHQKYREYCHAINLAPALTACTVKPYNNL